MLRLSHVWWALRTTWQVSPFLTTVYIGSALLRGIFPVLQVIASRFLINDVVILLQKKDAEVATILPWLLVLCILSLADTIILLIGARYVPKRLEDELNINITTMVMLKAYELPLRLFEDLGFQDTLERAQQGVTLNFVTFLRSFVESFTGIMQIFLLFSVLIFLEPFMILIVLTAMPPYSVIMWSVSRLRYQNEYKRAPDRRWTRYFTKLMLNRDNATEIRLLGVGNLMITRFRNLIGEFAAENKRVERRALVGGITFVSMTISLFFILFYRVIERVLLGDLTIGDIAIMGGAIARLSMAAEGVIAKLGLALERSLHIANLRIYLATPIEKADTIFDLQPSLSRGLLEFRDVSFTYPGSEREVLSHISFTIRPGETVAIVGENGAGKSTLVKLLAGIYKPDHGSIWLDEQNILTLPSRAIYKQVAFILQNFGRYEATAADNIAYGNPADYLDQPNKIESLAKELGIHAMIEAMPKGYETFLGRQFGVYDASGGQWQQLAIARAFAQDAALLVLDEPTANLDVRTEHAVFSRFVKLSENRTTLLISHRFTTVSMADRILVLSDGHITEEGTHNELMKKENGSYAQLYRLHYDKLQDHQQ